MAAETQKKTDTKSITDADVVSSLLGFFLKKIVTNDEQTRTSGYIKKITKDSATPEDLKKVMPAFTNLFTAKEKKFCEEKIFGDFEDNNLFFNQIVPFVRLYKIFINGNTTTELEIPFDIVAGKTPADSDSITKRILEGGNGGAVGVANFDWISEGKNEGNNSIYTVNLTIILQDASEIEKIRNIKTIGDKELSVSILHLLYPPFTKNEGKGTKFKDDPLTFDPQNNIIKAEIGWNLPFGYEQYASLFRTNLFLSLYKHNFTFHDSGKVEMQVTFIGNTETQLSNKKISNILNSDIYNKKKRDLELLSLLEEKLTNKRQERDDNQNVLENLADTVFGKEEATIEQGIIEQFKRDNDWNYSLFVGPGDLLGKVKEQKIQLSQQMNDIKTNFCMDVLQELLKESKIKSLVLNKKEFETTKFILSRETLGKAEITEIKERQQKDTGTLKDVNPPNKEEIRKTLEESTKKETIEINGIGYKDLTVTTLDSKKFEELFAQKNYEAGEGDRIVTYFFLGDLLEIMMKRSREKNYIFLSPFTFIDYQAYDTIDLSNDENFVIKNEFNGPKGLAILKNDSFPRYIAHMYNIPISIPVFTDWVNENIIKSEETTFTMNMFLRDVFMTLIPESISTMNVPNAPLNKVLTTSYHFLTKEKIEERSNIDVDRLSEYYRNKSQTFVDEKSYSNIVYISTNENNMSRFTGDRKKDCEVNVSHLDLNTATSVIRKATFARDDNQVLETANLLAANESGGTQIIRQVYHCNLELYGNNFFEPGDLIYIRPSYPGVGLNLDTFFKIGLGGYYRVIKTDNKINTSGFSTTLECRWEMFGDENSRFAT